MRKGKVISNDSDQLVCVVLNDLGNPPGLLCDASEITLMESSYSFTQLQITR